MRVSGCFRGSRSLGQKTLVSWWVQVCTGSPLSPWTRTRLSRFMSNVITRPLQAAGEDFSTYSSVVGLLWSRGSWMVWRVSFFFGAMVVQVSCRSSTMQGVVGLHRGKGHSGFAPTLREEERFLVLFPVDGQDVRPSQGMWVLGVCC